MKKDQIDTTNLLTPRYDEQGLIACIAIEAISKDVLMMAYMNEESLKLTIETGEAHYWSRSRQEIWHKGATSGNTQTIESIAIDCDQDCLLITVTMPKGKNGKVAACHTGRKSCFYREVISKNGEGELIFID